MHQLPIRPAGRDTLDAIPAMFARHPFPEARPCGLSSICRGAHVLDYSRVRASRDDIDVVAMYHPYCAIRGLRSCVDIEGPRTYRSAWKQVINLYAARLGWPLASFDVGVATARVKTSEAREAHLQAVMQAPFWRHGGALYAHLPMPHPLALATDDRLDTEYAANLQTAVVFVHALAQTLTKQFGDRARIVITSDHPLRPAVWCSDSGYSPYGSQGCKGLRKTFLDSDVPLIVAARRAAPAPSITSSLDAFSLLSSEGRLE